ncbi:GMC family oxidoreductase N-terminal domain-containing protein (plasmid) [Agrobacterium leguminum]|uniref:GMC family oxidoreductase n=1 Tax=Agrobacterium leguminum TaxID=2792015 RepID=UPI00272BC536|nr:GMC family oxidoreductase N-terminal domain-containing protein [Agrobacterium leguminum]WLE00697.1 GMC family oxidoreductase N-terminal domain-containing protein [Agrobacterium leguminum]
MSSYDYIVVGAGSAGCVIVNRLIGAGKSVLLLEAGKADNTPFIHIPATFVRVLGTERTWNYRTEPEPGANGRVMHIPQGKTLGGSSSVNAMIYIRGQAEDYDSWRDAGCVGWGYDDVLPVFKRSEANQRLSGDLHGVDGPLRVSDTRHRHPLSYAFLRAAQETGIRYNDDFNGERQEGVGFYQTTTFDGRRGSTAATFLKAVRNSPLLTLHTEATVEGLILENGAASGVRYRHANGEVKSATVREEVIVSSGGIGSPKVLMLSGIGPTAQLSGVGIPVIRDLTGVGENFQDHISASVYGLTKNPVSLFGNDKGWRAARNGLQYLLWRTGLLTSNVVESGAFVDTSGCGRPDVQLHVVPTLVGDADRAPPQLHGISLNPCVLRPTSRGTVTLQNADPATPLAIKANNLTTGQDIDTLVRGVELCRKILRAPSLKSIIDRELAPGEPETLDRATIENHCRQFAKTVFHPSGTCRMGTDETAVVDTQLRVRGVARLRVADASIMPLLVSGNTNAPSIMIGERCADFVLARR